MKKSQQTFVGIVGFIKGTRSYDYCDHNPQTGGMCGFKSVESLGDHIAYEFGKNFRKKITYEPPQGVDTRGTERGLCPRMYHMFSVLEKDRFEKAVLDALKGKQ